MAENKCICLDSKDWLTFGAVDASIYYDGGISLLNIVDNANCGCTEPVDLQINYCPFCGRKLESEVSADVTD